MASASIGGLASGLDTASIVEQFMQLEALPQTKLKTRVTTEQTKLTTLQGINTKLAALATAAQQLAGTGPTGATSVWSTLQATSSSTAVAVTASSTATPASLSVKVTGVAESYRAGFTQSVGLTTAGTVPTAVTVGVNGSTVDLTTDGTLGSLISEINDPANATGLKATALRSADGSYRLVVETATTGATQTFDITETGTGTAVLGGQDAALVRAGKDAALEINGMPVTSTSNTLTDIVPGVTLTLSAAAVGTTAEVKVARDATSRSDAVKALVEQANALLTSLAAATAGSTGTTKAGVLVGDSTLRRVTDTIRQALYPADGTSMASYGVQLDRSGKFVFDAAKFAKAYEADPAAVAAAFTGATGFAGRLEAAATQASDKYKGTVTSTISTRTEGIARLNKSIEQWDDRLELRRAALTRQYTALETALSGLQAQSSWLSSQLASLSASTSAE